MGYQPRILEKFTSLDGLLTYSFSMADYEQEMTQGLVIAHQPIAGASYGYLHRTAPPVKLPGTASFRASVLAASPTLVDTEVDNMGAILYRAGLGYLYSIDSAGTRRRVLAMLNSLPSVSWRAGDIFRKGISVEFATYDDWRAVTATTGTATITASGQTFSINNPGNLPSKYVTFRLRANTSAGIINPKLSNGANGYTFETARDSASANSEIKLTIAYNQRKVEYSNDNGASYIDDFTNLVQPTDHPPLSFDIEPGSQTITYTGGASQSLDIEWELYAPYSAG